MKSVAYHHFPRVVIEANRFWLFNPILKKRYENRPEERIRLKWAEYLLLQTDWKKSRIGFESPVKLRQSENTLRADLILYSDAMKPAILIECKSDSVKLNHSAAEQAARYNSKVNANHLVLTNGIEDYWFERGNGEIQPSENILTGQASLENLKSDFEYWNRRGFCSLKSNSEIRSWLNQALRTFWSDDNKANRQYLDFQQTVLPVPMNHYYKIFDMDKEQRLAMSFIGHDQTDNYIVGILNSKGANQGIVAVNLDMLKNGKENSATIFKGNQSGTFSVSKDLPIKFSDFDPGPIKNLPQNLMKFFD